MRLIRAICLILSVVMPILFIKVKLEAFAMNQTALTEPKGGGHGPSFHRVGDIVKKTKLS